MQRPEIDSRRIGVHALSFGSHWGMAVMRYHPETVERALLSSLEVSQSGDLYLPADDSFLTTALDKGLVAEVLPKKSRGIGTSIVAGVGILGAVVGYEVSGVVDAAGPAGLHVADKPALEERLRSRFEWGLLTDIQPPELETRVAILMKKADQAKVELPHDAAFFIAQRIRSNVRELEGALKRVIAHSHFMGRDITIELIRESLKDLLALQEVDVNTSRSGALNQALHHILPTQGENDLVMVMDADTTLDAGFLEGAARRLTGRLVAGDEARAPFEPVADDHLLGGRQAAQELIHRMCLRHPAAQSRPGERGRGIRGALRRRPAAPVCRRSPSKGWVRGRLRPWA